MTGRSFLDLHPAYVVALAFALLSPAATQAATCSVSSTADSGAGTLRSAVSDSTCDTINFAGLTLPATITLTSDGLVVDRNVTINGPGASQLTVMRSSEASPFRVVHIVAGTAAINGITIANGSTLGNGFESRGGGILVDSSAALALSNSTVSGNASRWIFRQLGQTLGGWGGGIASFGTLTVTNSTISGNNTCMDDTCENDGGGTGGGIFSEGGTLALTDSRVSNNNGGGVGGGIHSSVGATVTNSTVSGNYARFAGGINISGSATISGSTISDNSAFDRGGGIVFYGLADFEPGIVDTLTLVNSTVAGNTTACSSCASGVVNDHGILDVTNTTFSGNRSPVVQTRSQTVFQIAGGTARTRITHSTFAGNTGGLSTLIGHIDVPQPGQVEVRSNIFADTAGPACADPVATGTAPITDGGFNLERGTSCGFTATGSQSNVDPLLGPLHNNGGSTSTYALLGGSPAIDAGTCTDIQNNSVATDQRGVARPQGAACDIGAYELQPARRPVFTGFFAPVSNAPAANFLKAGQAVAVKFSLGGDFGLNVLAGSPGSQQVGCTLSPNTSVITDAVSAGSSGLTYDPATQTYTYVWKTDKSWANTCRRLTIAFSDGSLGTKSAVFTFTK